MTAPFAVGKVQPTLLVYYRMPAPVPLSPPRLVMLDFDGTLADSFPWFVEVVNEAAAKFGFRRINRTEVEALRALDALRMMRALDVSPWKVPRIATFMRARMRDGIERIALFPGIADGLCELRRAGIDLAVLTSNAEDNVRHVLGPAAGEIRYYVCGVSLFGKQGRIVTLLKRTALPPSAALLVGDELRDLAAARATGVRFAAVAWGYTHADALAGAGVDWLVPQPQMLARVLLGRGES